MTDLTIDASLGPELLEFWAKKCRALKAELEETKAALKEAQSASNALQVAQRTGEDESVALKALVDDVRRDLAKRDEGDQALRSSVAASMQAESEARSKAERISKENADLQLQVERLRRDSSIMNTQISTIYTQSAGLAAEADRSRKDAIAKMFPPVNFIAPNFQARIIHITDVQAVLNVVPRGMFSSRLYFLPRPPNCLPLRIHACAQPGYWFDPPVSMNDEEFELIVEGRLGEWSYLGRYTTAKLVGHVMHLSEWMNLDENTKSSHCARIASSASAPSLTSPHHHSPPPLAQSASIPAQMEVKRKFDTGEWTVPCYSLRCVGFNVPLYESLYAAAETTLRERNGRERTNGSNGNGVLSRSARSARTGMSSTPTPELGPRTTSERSVSPNGTEVGSTASRTGKRHRGPETNGTGGASTNGEREAKKVHRAESESTVS